MEIPWVSPDLPDQTIEYRFRDGYIPNILSVDPDVGVLRFHGATIASHFLGDDCIRNNYDEKMRSFYIPINGLLHALRRAGVRPAEEGDNTNTSAELHALEEEMDTDSSLFHEGSSDLDAYFVESLDLERAPTSYQGSRSEVTHTSPIPVVDLSTP